jgi:hypothetical protein
MKVLIMAVVAAAIALFVVVATVEGIETISLLVNGMTVGLSCIFTSFSIL